MNFQFISKKLSPKKIHDFLKKAYVPTLVIVVIVLLTLGIFFYYWFVYRLVTMELHEDVVVEHIDSEHLSEVLNKIGHRKEVLLKVQQQQYEDPFN